MCVCVYGGGNKHVMQSLYDYGSRSDKAAMETELHVCYTSSRGLVPAHVSSLVGGSIFFIGSLHGLGIRVTVVL